LGFGLAHGCAAGSSSDPHPVRGSGGSAGSAGGEVGLAGGTGIAGGISVDGGSEGSGRVRPADLAPSFLYRDPSGTPSYKDPSLIDDVGSRFGGPTSTSGAPSLVYPLSESVHPINLLDITFQWHQGVTTNTLFRLEVSGKTATGELKQHYFYVPCTQAECVFQMPRGEWWDLGDLHTGERIDLRVLGTSEAGGAVATSSVVSIEFSDREVNGALYYWAANKAVVKRAALGAESAVDFIAPNSATNEFGCTGCHSLSRDGKVIAFAVLGASHQDNSAAIQVAPTTDPTHPILKPGCCESPYEGVSHGPTDQFGTYVALNHDGTMAAISGVTPTAQFTQVTMRQVAGARAGTDLRVYDIFAEEFQIDGEHGLIVFMEFSPDSRKLVAARGRADQTGWADVANSRIVTLDVAADGSLSNMKTLVEQQPGWTHYYPSYSPDGRWVVFVSAPNAGAPDAWRIVNGNAHGVLRMVEVSTAPVTCPGQGCQELTRATRYSPADASALRGQHTTWPKFSPFMQGSMMFVSYTSNIDYGFLARNKTQIWMAAIDPTRATNGDPSFPPIWLPYQASDDQSLTPYWAETLPCTAEGGTCSGCAVGEICEVTSGESGPECRCKGIAVR
jgi:hypothetical protein